MATLPFSFVHCADLHLDSPFKGLAEIAPGLARRLQRASYQAFDAIIDLAIERRVDALLVAGDVFDAEDRSLRAQLDFRTGLARASAAGIRSFVIHGNHDPLSGWEAALEWPAGVHRFGVDVEAVPLEREGTVVAHVLGSSYAEREYLDDPLPNYVAAARDLDSPFSIALLHTDLKVSGPYAPVATGSLEETGIDYWALGHVHQPRIVHRHPWIVYPGTPQGRSRREAGPRGCCVVSIGTDGEVTVEQVATDAIRWRRSRIDLGECPSIDSLLGRLNEEKESARHACQGSPALLAVDVVGRSPLHGTLRHIDPERDLANPVRRGEEDRADFVWIENIRVRSAPPLDFEALRRRDDLIADVLGEATALRQSETSVQRLRELLLARPESRRIAREIGELGEDELLLLLEEAETLAVELLLPDEG